VVGLSTRTALIQFLLPMPLMSPLRKQGSTAEKTGFLLPQE